LRQAKATQVGAKPLKGKRHGGLSGPPRSIEKASALAAPVGGLGRDHRNGVLVSPAEASS
jgi:hypothetical protein